MSSQYFHVVRYLPLVEQKIWTEILVKAIVQLSQDYNKRPINSNLNLINLWKIVELVNQLNPANSVHRRNKHSNPSTVIIQCTRHQRHTCAAVSGDFSRPVHDSCTSLVLKQRDGSQYLVLCIVFILDACNVITCAMANDYQYWLWTSFLLF